MITSIKTSKFVAGVVGLGLAASVLFGVSANVASAQAMTLAQLVNLFISLGIIPPSEAAAAQAAIANSATTPAASSYTFNSDLTVGSTGADVTALQNTLIANGDLASGLNTGYFGALTKAGVMKWQSSVGVPSTGYVGPLSRAKLNASSSTTTTTTTTTTTGTGTTASTVTNTGVEGILTANLNATPSSGQNVYAGDMQDSLLGIKLQAQLSPIDIQRVTVDLGNSSTFYTKFFQTLYLVSDTGQVLAQAALNSNTVTKQTSSANNEYFLTFSGFNYTVPGDNSIHVLTVKGDLYSSIDSAYSGSAISLAVDANGVRGVDGAGVDQYAPLATISNSVTLNKAISDTVQVQLSTDASTPLATQAVASQGSNTNELDGQTALVFDLYAQKDWFQVDNLTAGFNGTVGSGNASATTAYLFAGSNQISSAAISYNGSGQYGTAVFQNVNYKVPAGTTQAFTIKTDIKNSNTVSRSWYATVTSNYILAENSVGNTISSANLTGSATGNAVTVTSAGPVFALVGTPTISSQIITGNSNQTSTTTVTTTFNVTIQALGGNVYIGTQAASTTFGFSLYQGGVPWTIAAGGATSTYSAVTSWSNPSSGVTTSGLPGTNVAFEVQQNNTTPPIPVTFTFQNHTINNTGYIPTNTYAVGLDSINWSKDGLNDITVANFMAGQTTWRTAQISLP